MHGSGFSVGYPSTHIHEHYSLLYITPGFFGTKGGGGRERLSKAHLHASAGDLLDAEKLMGDVEDDGRP